MVCGPTHIHPAQRLARLCATTILVLQSLLPAREAAAYPSHPGKWTLESQVSSFRGTAVNLVLLPGGSTTYHSRVMWWEHDGDADVMGDVVGWNPPNDAATNDGAFPPAAQFKSLGLDDPPPLHELPSNLFCAGQTMLADGRMLVTGGTDIGEAGNVSTLYFDPGADSNGVWTRADDMAHRRWYPDNVLLPDGRVVTASGSTYTHYICVGGFADAAPDTQTRMLQRMGVVRPNTLEPSEVARKTTAAQEPFDRLSDAASAMASNTLFLYGGRNSVPALSDKLYKIERFRNEFGSDYLFRWSELSQSGQIPPARTGTQLLVLDGGSDFLLIGGLDAFGTDSTVWRGSLANNVITWKKLTNLSGTSLPALHGHGAVYDPGVKRVFVFGGSGTTAETPTNSSVYSLELGVLATSDTLFVTPATASGPNPPNPRSYASLTHVPYARGGMPGAPTLSKTRAMLFGGRTASGGYSDSLHAMWIKSATEVVWEAVPLDASPRPAARAKHAASLDGNTLWLVMSGGETEPTTSAADVWSYSITCGSTQRCDSTGSLSWEAHPPLPLAVRGHVAAALAPEPAFARFPQVFVPGAAPGSQWTTLASDPHWQEWFPFGFVAPRRSTDPAGSDSLRVFYAGPETGSPTLHLNRTSQNRWSNMTSGTANFLAGAAVMHRPGKVMKCGTRDTGGRLPHEIVGRTAVIDLNASSPTWTEAATADSMIARRNHNLVILPSGEVIVVGGARWGGNNLSTDANSVKMPQIWNPDTLTAGHWYSTAPTVPFDASSVRRHYHSTAILLPDARVLCAGGAFDSTQQRKVDLYSPYYLFDANGNPRTRPQILGAPARVSYGERFALRLSAADTDLAKVSLLRPGATTHGFDQNQRLVPATFSVMSQQVGGERRYLVTAPADSMDAPPGDYLLFALNAAGTPSIARWINLRPTNFDAVAPSTVTDLVKVCSHGTWAELQWTTSQSDPGGPIKLPTQKYDLRWRTQPMPDWATFMQSGTPAAHTPAASLDPDAAPTTGTSVFNLQPNTQYYFRLANKDFQSGSGNWSGLSNQLVFTTYDEQCGGAGGGGGGGHEDPLTVETAVTFGPGVPSGGGSSDADYLENTLFANVPPGTAAVDLLRLPHGPRWTATGARIRLSRGGRDATRFTGVRLRGVALSPGQSAFAAGSEIAVGSLIALTRVSHADGRDLSASLAAGKPFEGHPGDTLLVEFGDATPGRIGIETSGAQLVAAPLRSGVELQCEYAGSWRTVAHHDPRALRALALHGVPSAGRVRLVFRGDHRLHNVSRFEPGTLVGALAHEPAAVTHSRIGSVAADLGGEGLLVAGGEHAYVDFAVPSEQANGLDWFLEVTGEHVASAEVGLAANQEASREAPPVEFALYQNQPNPFDQETRIRFDLPRPAHVRLEVFDLAGRRVATLANAEYEPGRHGVAWGRRGHGGRVPAGIYTYRLTAGDRQMRRQLVVFP